MAFVRNPTVWNNIVIFFKQWFYEELIISARCCTNNFALTNTELRFKVYIHADVGFQLQINEGVSQVSSRRGSLLLSDVTCVADGVSVVG